MLVKATSTRLVIRAPRWETLLLVAAFFLRLASSVTADISFVLLAVYALLGRSHAVKALTLTWLFGAINPAIAASPEYAAIGRYLVFIASFASVLMSHGFAKMENFVFSTFLFGLFLVTHSIVFSIVPDVSFLKAASWLIVTITLCAAFAGLRQNQREELRNWLFFLLSVLIVFSLPFVFVPSVGYARNGTGFQGLLAHPQIFGPVVAVVGSLAFGRFLEGRGSSTVTLCFFLICLLLVIMSGTRTAGFAMILALLGTFFLSSIFGKKSKRAQKLNQSLSRLGAFIFFAIVTSIVAIQQAPSVSGYINKYGAEEGRGLFEIYIASRGVLYSPMIENIEKHPMSGIGFGIASDPATMNIKRDPVFGIPMGASIEKGVLPIAVFEELGLPGFALAVFWVLFTLKRALVNGKVTLIGVMTALFINLGESVLFSVGGLGLLFLVILASAVSPPSRTNHLPAS